MSGRGRVGEIFAVAEQGRVRRALGRRGRKGRAEGGRRGSGAAGSRRGVGEFAFRTCKEQGEWAELCFMARARQMGMTVLKPYGDSSAYDVGIERDGRLVRVQTKSTTFRRGRTFTCNLVGPGRKAYRPGMFDYFAVYPIPVDVWYIVPFAKASKTSVSLQFTPEKAGHKYEEYREAWHLLRES
jgi:PD-(D/E)XK endonuclease